MCDTGTCRIWSWALRTSDRVALNMNDVPTGDDVFVLDGETFLVDAIEITGDRIGDDDLLCESNERCWVARNAGAYQGHGAGQSVTFTDGTVMGVQLYQRAINGYFVP